jgi:AcrR family transcriptional regulator
MTVSSPLASYAHSVLERPPSRLDQQERIDRVLAATLQSCARDGPLSLKISDIAEVASVSTATIYKDFANGDDVLALTVLRAFEILQDDWALDQITPVLYEHDYKEVAAFLIKLCETNRDPFSAWLLHLDLAAAATPDDRVRAAHIRFQEHTITYGIRTLPTGALEAANARDLVQTLIGTIQLQVVFALLDDTPSPGTQPSADALDLPATIDAALAWIGQAPGLANIRRQPNPPKNEVQSIPFVYPKSDVQLSVEDLLGRTLSRTDNAGRRKKILAATMQVCAANGMEAGNVSQIAKMAGVSTASVYRLFADKTALVHASIYHFLPLYADATMRALEETDPRLRFEKLLIAQALIVSDPFGAWLFRYIVDYGTHQNDEIKAFSQMARAQSDLFWEDQIRRLVAEGYLLPTNVKTTRTMIYGGVQRRCILARALHQNDAFVWSEIHDSAKVAVDMLFGLYGMVRVTETAACGTKIADFEALE